MALVAADGFQPRELPRASPYRLLDFGRVLVQIQVAPITPANLKIHLDAQSEQLEQIVKLGWKQAPHKVVIIVDGSVGLMPPPEARPLQAQWLKQHKDKLSLMTHKMAFILPNPWLRGFLSAVFFIAPQPVPMTTFGSMEAAVAWAIHEMDLIGGEVAPELRERGVEAVNFARQNALALATG